MDYSSLSCFLIVLGFNLYFMKDGIRFYLSIFNFEWPWLSLFLIVYVCWGFYNLGLFILSIY